MKLQINSESRTPIYKQLVNQVERAIRSGKAENGELLPSMNELADSAGISKETVKKAYTILRDKGLLEARQGKGFYIMSGNDRHKLKVLVLFDKLSSYKQITFNRMLAEIGDRAELTIRLHNQSVDLLEYYLDESLDMYDYYVVSPHFPLDPVTQKKACRLLHRIPNRKFIMVDHWMPEIKGNYGAVYQDFSMDSYDCLAENIDRVRKYSKVNVISLPSSLYQEQIQQAIMKFCTNFDIDVEFHTGITAEITRKNELYILLNSQLESSLIDLAHISSEKELSIGSDIGVISYNESPIHEIVLGGLTTLSTDFDQMGALVAKMIIENKLSKVKCDFRLTVRSTF
ncbi:MAG: GntR family transcriptional regulator [Bacteroidales bacterium]|nr:GntR family transcriptional regulator [Bacteroidales bacterium]MDE7126398.1 GntR family transcriptional regulator [Bacteroidales bacterium]